MTCRAICAAALGLMLSAGCSEDVELAGRDGGTDYPNLDGSAGGECNPEGTECNNCLDDDGDGLIDGFDPQCTGAADNLEGSFATGIPGDNRDAVKQDCFFDGNSGAGNDGCEIHVCCLLETCPPNLPGGVFDPAKDCPAITQDCIDTCAPLTPPGCDCFGCCTVCEPGGECNDVFINPETAPNCDQDNLDNPSACPRCTKNEVCNPAECNNEECSLCPGQLPEDLPPTCEAVECPGGTVCEQSSDCGDDLFCSFGCCINVIQ